MGKDKIARKLSIVHPQAGAVDIGASELYSNCYTGDSVEVFAHTHTGRQLMAHHFVELGVDTVAIEATGEYWLTVYEALESVGLEVYVVNGAHVKQLPGRKSDISDAVWLRTLHQYGLLRGGFIPPEEVRALRTYVRVRDTHIDSGAREVQRMRKNLELMGLKVQQMISQIQGASGMAMMKAMLAGERNPRKLIALTHKRVQQKAAQLEEGLKGNFRQEYLFGLEQAIAAWEFHQAQILICDKKIEAQLGSMIQGLDTPDITDKPKSIRHHAPQIDKLHEMLLTLTQGKNPTQIEGINDQTLLKLLSLTGLDMSAFPSEKQFASYAGLTPCNESSGKTKRRRRRKKRGNPELKTTFMLIAQSVAKMKNELGAFYQDLKARRGYKIALKALARKIALRYYRIMKFGRQYVIRGVEHFNQNLKKQKIRAIKKQMKNLDIRLHDLAT